MRRVQERHSQRLLALLAVAYLLLGLGYVAVIPPFEGHDVLAHFRAVAYLRTHRQLPRVDAATAAESYELVQQPPLYYALAAAASAPWPIEEALRVAATSVNPYFGGPENYRQSLTLPGTAPGALRPVALARLVSLLGGLMLLGAVWRTATLVAPARPHFALAATAVAAYNPHLLFLAGTVTNDAWAAGTTAVALACGFEARSRGLRPFWWCLTGAAFGVAALTKYSALLVAAPLAALWLLSCRGRTRRAAAIAAASAVLAAALVAGWWYGRNLALYGELMPAAAMSAAIGTMNRARPLGIAETLAYVPWLLDSYWGVFVALIAPAGCLTLMRALSLLGVAGVPLGVVRTRRDGSVDAAAVLVLTAWALLVAAAVLYWTRTVSFGEQGRLAEIGSPAFAVLIALGWSGWAPGGWRRRAQGVLALSMLASAIVMLVFLRRSFGPPPPVSASSEPDRPIAAQFEGGMRLLGLDLPDGAALAQDGRMRVRLYFTTDRPIASAFTLYVHLADAEDRLLFAHDGAPVRGSHPTPAWQPGVVFADDYVVRLRTGPVASDLATLSIGFYPFEQPDHPVAVLGSDGQPVADRVVAAKVRLHPAGTSFLAERTTPIAEWAGGIALAGARVRHAHGGAGMRSVHLRWLAGETVHLDYTVFVQALDAEGGIVWQSDRQPRDGLWPTSTWRAGDVVSDEVRLEVPPDAPWHTLILGLYSQDGRRLELERPGAESNALTLLTRD